jgi:hypothetical protein
MIAQARSDEPLDPLGKTILQDVDVETGIEQKFRSARYLFGYESKRFVRPASEWRSVPLGLPAP